MLIVIGAVKGSPGASTAALALTACWPRPALLVEADVFGGDLLYRLRAPGGQALLSPWHTLMQMTAVAPEAITADAVHAFTQVADGDLKVLLGAGEAGQSALLARSWTHLAPLLARLPGTGGGFLDVVVDAGRWSDTPAHRELAKAASLLVTVTRPATLATVGQLRERVNTLTEWRAGAGCAPLPTAVVVRAAAREAKRAAGELGGELARLRVPADVAGALLEDKAAELLTGANLPRGDLLTGAERLAAALAARPAAPDRHADGRPR